MRTRMALILVVGLLLAADPKNDPIKEELKKLQGTWEVSSVEANGDKVPTRKPRN